jgi:hypothetical protein
VRGLPRGRARRRDGAAAPACRHLFHVGCVVVWLHEHRTCPLCRCELPPRKAAAPLVRWRPRPSSRGSAAAAACLIRAPLITLVTITALIEKGSQLQLSGSLLACQIEFLCPERETESPKHTYRRKPRAERETVALKLELNGSRHFPLCSTAPRSWLGQGPAAASAKPSLGQGPGVRRKLPPEARRKRRRGPGLPRPADAWRRRRP